MVSIVDAGEGFVDFSTDVAGGAADATTDAGGYVGGGLLDTATDVGGGLASGASSAASSAGSLVGSAVKAPFDALRWGAETGGGALLDTATWGLDGVFSAGSSVGGAVFGPFIDMALKVGIVALAAWFVLGRLDVDAIDVGGGST